MSRIVWESEAGKKYSFDLKNPIDASLSPARNEGEGPSAFHLPNALYSTARGGDFVGDVEQGGSCNVENIFLSPHGNGTHTECSGHIWAGNRYVGDALPIPIMLCQVVSVTPFERGDGDYVITEGHLAEIDTLEDGVEAIFIRTLPNGIYKKTKNWAGTGAPYFLPQFVAGLRASGIKHLLCDLPSLDREVDPHLKAHHAWFQESLPDASFTTVTEMAYLDDAVKDGLYLLSLGIAPLMTNASPSRVVLWKVTQ